MAQGRHRLHLTASDPLTLIGITDLFIARQDVFEILETAASADVLVCAVRELTPATFDELRSLAATTSAPVVLMAEDFDVNAVALIAECRVRSLVIRTAATADHVVDVVVATARGGAIVPSRLLGRILHQLTAERRSLHRSLGLAPSGLTTREIDVLRLAAAGWSTREISEALNCEEGALYSLVSAMLSRLGLRNRTHAVTYAITAGVI